MNVLTINLTDYTYEIERRDDLAEWLGGDGDCRAVNEGERKKRL